ncbi:MAG: tetratricopeptide repeat protein [Candidatus Coatesbacteria bacterium]|nr:tetratricopeptide repeat protein [Candidatus Coatesbacteria bacterium]
MIRIIVILFMVLISAFTGDFATAESIECSWDETPVSCDSSRWYELVSERNIKSWDEYSEDEITELIASNYIDGQVTTEDWFESTRLFSAACYLAGEDETDAGERAKLMMIALKAAERTLKQNPDTCRISDIATDMKPIDAWFCSTILRLVKYSASNGKCPAIRQYSIYLLQNALGNQKAAREAIEDAYTMCPNDPVIQNSIGRIRTDMNDFSGALEVVKTDDSENTPSSDIWAISREATNAQRMGDIHLEAGDLDKSRAELLRAWDALDRLQKKKEELKFVGVPVVELSRNRTATSLGLIALQKGDIEEARSWLERSLTHDMFMEYKGYDMRLVKKAISNPALKNECVKYLKAASVLGTDEMKDEAFAMLKTLEPDIDRKELPGVSPTASVPKRIILASKKCREARGHITEGKLDEAQQMLDEVWAECEEIITDPERAKIAYKEGIACLRNMCATDLGLVATEKGDLEKAARWLKASALDTEQGYPPKRYDLELVEKLSWQVAFKDECIKYLEYASKMGPQTTKKEAKELLDKLLGAQN